MYELYDFQDSSRREVRINDFVIETDTLKEYQVTSLDFVNRAVHVMGYDNRGSFIKAIPCKTFASNYQITDWSIIKRKLNAGLLSIDDCYELDREHNFFLELITDAFEELKFIDGNLFHIVISEDKISSSPFLIKLVNTDFDSSLTVDTTSEVMFLFANNTSQEQFSKKFREYLRQLIDKIPQVPHSCVVI